MAVTTKKVLVVDDDIGILESFSWMLQGRCELILTGKGEDALRSLEEVRPSLVFLDILMPDINGLDVLKLIRKKYPNLKVVIITGTPEEENVIEAMKHGVESYLNKPLDVFDILEIVDSVLDWKGGDPSPP